MNNTSRRALNQEKVVEIRRNLSGFALQDELRERCRSAALEFCEALLQQEVEALCGAPFARKGEGQYHRGGSEETTVIVEDGKVRMRRPRVRGAEGEIALRTLEKLQEQDLLDERMRESMLLGVSTRNYGRVVNGYSKKLGISKSNVSRAFKRASQKELDCINQGSLEEHEFVALMIDGIEIAGTVVIAALGITSELKKVPLGLKEGDTENAAVVQDLLSSLEVRGFKLHCDKLLAILDGSKALKKGLKAVFGDKLIVQRCWLHKARNICAYLPKKLHGQLNWRMKRLMNLRSFSEAQKEYGTLRHWLEEISDAAAESLDEAGEELLTLHALGITGELRKSLSSTNLIESLFSVVRAALVRVKRHRLSSKQKLRWVASAILEHHRSKMRKLRGVNQKHVLIAALSSKLELKAA